MQQRAQRKGKILLLSQLPLMLVLLANQMALQLLLFRLKEQLSEGVDNSGSGTDRFLFRNCDFTEEEMESHW
jgi:hypothetical protein